MSLGRGTERSMSMRRRGALLAAALALVLLPTATATADLPLPISVPQAHGHFAYRPKSLFFRYQPPGSFGEEEAAYGTALYPPIMLTGLGPWAPWTNLSSTSGARAVTSGWLHYDTCEPNCLHGRYAKVRARVEVFGEGDCEKDGDLIYAFEELTVTPVGGPSRTRFIECGGKLRSGRKSTVIPAGVGFFR
jgi:hypothetical protein